MGFDATLTARGVGEAAVMCGPIALGYVRVQLLMTADELAIARDRLAAFAEAEGYALGGVFTEYVHTAPAAFHALVEAAKRYEASAVVVPSLRHLAVLGSLPTLERYLERCTGAQVLVANEL